MTITAAPSHEIVQATKDDERRQCLDIVRIIFTRRDVSILTADPLPKRVQVFHHEQGFPADEELDEYVAPLWVLKHCPETLQMGQYRQYGALPPEVDPISETDWHYTWCCIPQRRLQVDPSSCPQRVQAVQVWSRAGATLPCLDQGTCLCSGKAGYSTRRMPFPDSRSRLLQQVSHSINLKSDQ